MGADPAMGPRTGVIIANTGSPDDPSPESVRRYLSQFLSNERSVRAFGFQANRAHHAKSGLDSINHRFPREMMNKSYSVILRPKAEESPQLGALEILRLRSE